VIRPAELIERKRDGGELTAEEMNELMLAYARGEVPDYQLAASAAHLEDRSRPYIGNGLHREVAGVRAH